MNEVTKIHLGRQAYAISADAHTELRTYLDAIRQRVHDEDVIQEIELRMSELLTERGVKKEQVILPTDVHFLKEQLGAAKDFAEEEEQEQKDTQQSNSKRLFRDTDNAMIAGVAAGLANYFDVDPLLVRLAFVITTFAGGWGILIYLVLWILVPEAKTSSEHLMMFGKPVTIENLKDSVKRADVKAAARRANSSLAEIINTAFRIVLRFVGALLVTIGLSALLGLISAVIYMALRSNVIAQESVFPASTEDHTLVYLAAGVLMLVPVFVILFGISIFRRKWPIRTWATGTLVGILLIGLATIGALVADVAPQVRDNYNAGFHTTVRTLPSFKDINLSEANGDVNILFQTASTYSVSMRYYGRPNLHPIQTSVENKTLIINTNNFSSTRNCQALCIPNTYELTITVYSPNPPQTEYSSVPPVVSPPVVQHVLTPTAS
jgi:phage shock protein PspC (stress-responsive transcriptional regulator)